MRNLARWIFAAPRDRDVGPAPASDAPRPVTPSDVRPNPAPTAGRARAIVVDSSPACRSVIRSVLEASGDIVVVGEAADVGTALALVDDLRPRLITMDLAMPQTDGIDGLRAIASRHPSLPILVVTNEACVAGSPLAAQAIASGASCIVPKPVGFDDVTASELLRLARATALGGLDAASFETERPASRVGEARRPRVLAIAAGDGGAAALARVLIELPVSLRCPIAVAPRFTTGNAAWFARTLRTVAARRVEIVSTGLHEALPGVVYLADDGMILRLEREGIFTAERAEESARTAANALFESVAAVHGGDAVGVLLRGHGSDGATGLALLRSRGAPTFAEAPGPADGSFEMTRVACALGAASQVLSLERLTDAIVSCVTGADTRETWRPPTAG